VTDGKNKTFLIRAKRGLMKKDSEYNIAGEVWEIPSESSKWGIKKSE